MTHASLWRIAVKYAIKTRLSTSKYHETRAFYEGALGMTVVEEWNEPGDVGAILAFSGGHQEEFLELNRTEGQKEFDGLSLQFRVDRVTDFLATLCDEIEFEGPTERPWGSKYLHLRDPDNIQVIIYEGGF